MPHCSPKLVEALDRAIAVARERNREHATPEDLLIALIDDEEAASVMRACRVDPERLRRDLVEYMEGAIERPAEPEVPGAPQTAELRRIVHFAFAQARSAGREQVT